MQPPAKRRKTGAYDNFETDAFPLFPGEDMIFDNTGPLHDMSDLGVRDVLPWEAEPPTPSASQEQRSIEDFMNGFFDEDISGGLAVPEAPPNGKLAEHFALVVKLQEVVNHIYEQQRCMQIPAPPEQVQALEHNQAYVTENCKQGLDSLQRIFCTSILLPEELQQFRTLSNDYNRYIKQMVLCQRELQFWVNYSPNKQTQNSCFAELAITKQPHSKTVKRNSKFCNKNEDAITVELLKAPKTACNPIGPVTAALFDPKSKNPVKNKLVNYQQELDENGYVSFADLKFTDGTRKNQVYLAFSVQVEYVNPKAVSTRATLTTGPSLPFIVLTNENQWFDTEGLLLKSYIFQNRSDTSWCQFANCLQSHYLQASRQDLCQCRPMSSFDFTYLHRTYFRGNNTLNQREFTPFWTSYGPIIKRIRHQKPFSRLWRDGLIYGFITKSEAEKILYECPLKSVLVRFSERKPGSIAIAYSRQNRVSLRTEIGHLLVDTDSIPKYLNEHEHFAYIVKCEFKSPRGPHISAVNKAECLQAYCTSNPNDVPDGYDENLVN